MKHIGSQADDRPSSLSDLITLFMCGDVMTGRGIDQVLPYPSDPILHESYLKNARGYLELAEEAHGPIQRPVSSSYIWGDALEELERVDPDVRIINLETSITSSSAYWRGKGINYRMHPCNIASLTAAKIDYASLANNHVLDWGYAGLEETLTTLQDAEIKSTGAGRNRSEAEAPAVLEVEGKGRVIVFSLGFESSGIPSSWAASEDKAGVNLIKDHSQKTVRLIKQQVAQVKRPGDIVVASIHWGGNWGYDIHSGQKTFAHQLIDEAAIDVIHGHSSHHVKGLEVYREKLILYGCGDFLNDYEGISGYEAFRDDLALMYFMTVAPSTGELVSLQMIPTQIKRFRVNRASRIDSRWLRDLLNREGRTLGTRVKLDKHQRLMLFWK